MKKSYDSILYDYAMSLVGTPYLWGGSNVLAGFDCSGLCIELMQSCGAFPQRQDTTAQGLYNNLYKTGAYIGNARSFGSLAFYGQSTTKITHVGFVLDSSRVLEAGSGGRRIKTVEDAARYNAVVRIRPIVYRSDLVAVGRPDYTSIGML